jgi:hypothetical protein
MKSECDFYLDRAAKCLDMAEHLNKQYRGDLVQIARGWVQLAQEEADWDHLPTADDFPRRRDNLLSSQGLRCLVSTEDQYTDGFHVQHANIEAGEVRRSKAP